MFRLQLPPQTPSGAPPLDPLGDPDSLQCLHNLAAPKLEMLDTPMFTVYYYRTLILKLLQSPA